jgi:hypothetical protein
VFSSPSGRIYGFTISGSRAFLLGWGGTLEIFDISDPLDPVLLSTSNPSSFGMGRIVVSDDIAFITRSSWGGLLLVDVSDGSNPVLLEKYFGDYRFSHEGVAVSGSTVYSASGSFFAVITTACTAPGADFSWSSSGLRVGFEDGVYLEPGKAAETNTELVERLVALVNVMGCRVATTEEARAWFGTRR